MLLMEWYNDGGREQCPVPDIVPSELEALFAGA